jgi:hypothetical protein
MGPAGAQGLKVRRLAAGGNWIRNFSSALPSVVSRVFEIRDPGRAAGSIEVRFDSPQGRTWIQLPVDRLRFRLRRLPAGLKSSHSAEGAHAARSNGIKEGGTASRSSPWLRTFGRQRKLVCRPRAARSPARIATPERGATVQLEFFSFSCRANHSIEPRDGLGGGAVAACAAARPLARAGGSTRRSLATGTDA